MKCFFILILSVVSGYRINKIEGIEGKINLMEFDNYSNAYVVVNNYDENVESSRLYKLNAQKNLVLTLEIPSLILNIIINSQNDVYLFPLATDGNVRLLRRDSSTVEDLYNFHRIMAVLPFIDNEDNIFHNTENGIVMLRGNETAPVAITNLEKLFIYNDFSRDVDKDGNVYLALSRMEGGGFSVALITVESKYEIKPSAQMVDRVNGGDSYVTELKADNDGGVFFSVTDNKLKKLRNGNVQDVISYDNGWYNNLNPVGGNVFLFALSLSENYSICSFLYITNNDFVVMLPDLEGLPDEMCFFSVVENDSEGNMFIGYHNGSEAESVISLRKEGNVVVKINMENTSQVYSIKADADDNVWVLTGEGLFLVKKGTIDAEWIPGSSEGNIREIKINKGENEVFLLGDNGVYVCSN